MQVNDDGEGWITCVKDIHARKVSRALDPAATTSQIRPDSRAVASMDLPSRSQRAACATTDFAMQNVMLQMNLELLTVDGVRVRKLKSWVFRCAACFTVYTGNETSRLFCGRCGSPSLQRIAASVDGRTGQFRLHLKKNYRYNLRGTQFNLPAPGKGNKFKGDLLLREDQLLYGAWSQKVKSSKTQQDSQCIFGADITSSLGCSTDLLKRDDIKVGFGGKNPNASKFGRERRGKKKKSAEDKACGLRRY
jgi:RNA-binding protein NOB1